MQKIALTGIKPTGSPHIGNYLGMAKPALALAKDHQALYFIADYHALTTIRDPEVMRQLSYEAAATWLAFGLDPDKSIFYRQSDVPEIFEFTWILSCFTAKGLLNRAHAYKAAVDQNVALNRDPDQSVNCGLFNYPVLMAADILMFKSNVVPVGEDQVQHIEIARDIADAFNRQYGEILTLPEALAQPAVPGIDGRKMSKSYDNTIPLFASQSQMKKRVMRIVTDSKKPEDPKNPLECNIFALYQHFASPEQLEQTKKKYLEGGLAYGELKKELLAMIEAEVAPKREKYEELISDTDRLDAILMEGAEKARKRARALLEKVRLAVVGRA